MVGSSSLSATNPPRPTGGAYPAQEATMPLIYIIVCSLGAAVYLLRKIMQ